MPIPAAPSVPSVVYTGLHNVAVGWEAVPTALSYTVRLNGNVVSAANPNLNFIIEGLTPATGYTVTVSATNSYGQEGPQSPVLLLSTETPPTPGTPTLVVASNTRDNLRVTWNSVPHASVYLVVVNGVTYPSGLEVNVPNPALGTDYVVSVVAVSSYYVSGAEAAVTVRTPDPLVYTSLNLAVSIEGKNYVLSGTVLVTEV